MGSQKKRVGILALGRWQELLGAAAITDGWSRRADVDTVELIHWDIALPAASLLPGVAAFHSLPLTSLRSRGRAHALAPVVAMDGALSGICGDAPYDVVVNLSYSRFAGYIAPLLAGGDQHAVLGALVDDAGHWRCSHPALDYLGSWGLDPELNVFAHQDLWALASRARLGGLDRLPPDPVADNLAAHARTDDTCAPLLVAPGRAAGPADTFAWNEFVTRCRARTGRPVVLISEPGHAADAEALARATGCELANWPLRHLASLLRRSAGLVARPSGLSNLAGLVGVPQVVLCSGAAAPMDALCRDALYLCPRGGPPATEEMVALVEAHLLEEEVPSAAFTSAARRIVARHANRENSGALGCAIPAWWNASQDDRADDEAQHAWRTAWLRSWLGGKPPREAVARLAHTATPRLDRARHDRARLGAWIREEERAQESWAHATNAERVA